MNLIISHQLLPQLISGLTDSLAMIVTGLVDYQSQQNFLSELYGLVRHQGLVSFNPTNVLTFLESTISMEDARMMKHFLANNDGSWRILAMTDQASINVFNALLKIVEESSNLIFILFASNVTEIPATLRSRCHLLNCNVSSHPLCSQDLLTKLDLNSNEFTMLYKNILTFFERPTNYRIYQNILDCFDRAYDPMLDLLQTIILRMMFIFDKELFIGEKELLDKFFLRQDFIGRQILLDEILIFLAKAQKLKIPTPLILGRIVSTIHRLAIIV